MTTRTRRALTALSLLYVAAVGALVSRVPLPVLNLLLAILVVPMVWLIWVFTRGSAYQHANREARAVEKVHGSRPLSREQRAQMQHTTQVLRARAQDLDARWRAVREGVES